MKTKNQGSIWVPKKGHKCPSIRVQPVAVSQPQVPDDHREKSGLKTMISFADINPEILKGSLERDGCYARWCKQKSITIYTMPKMPCYIDDSRRILWSGLESAGAIGSKRECSCCDVWEKWFSVEIWHCNFLANDFNKK